LIIAGKLINNPVFEALTSSKPYPKPVYGKLDQVELPFTKMEAIHQIADILTKFHENYRKSLL